MTDGVFRDTRELPDEPHVLTIGSFDGVHRGHQYLLERVRQSAHDHNVTSLAVTFDPLPAEVLRPDKAPKRLCTVEHRAELIRSSGIDRVLILNFDEAMSKQSADEFLDDLVQYANPKAIVVGADFAFGHKRRGTPDFLRDRSTELGFDVVIMDRVNPDGIELSSSAVRRALTENGDVAAAREILGRNFGLCGTVTTGDQRGRTLGYPTANLDVPSYLTFPSDGIYAGFVENISADPLSKVKALVYVGTRPTFWQTERVVEAFLLDFEGDLYGKTLCVEFVDRIRGDQRFASVEELVSQMQRDEADGRAIFQRMIDGSLC